MEYRDERTYELESVQVHRNSATDFLRCNSGNLGSLVRILRAMAETGKFEIEGDSGYVDNLTYGNPRSDEKIKLDPNGFIRRGRPLKFKRTVTDSPLEIIQFI